MQYRAYGSVLTQQVEEIQSPLRFQGQYYDAETGLHYNRHRYYSPETGRFTTADPIGLAGGLNNYQYAPNPTGWIDPLGLVNELIDCPGSATAKLGKNSYKNFVDDPLKPSSLNPQDIRYMQSSIKNTTGDYTVLGNAEALKSGALKAENLTTIKVWKDTEGNIWSLDHRRLAAFKESGMNSIPVEWATADEVKAQAWKMTTKTSGVTIKLKLGDGQNITLGAK
ncbi:RHS repeat-associated core domain-containing protein [Vibrio rhizosphaerae]|uniref:RHS repeat-associated core domain-containing protein n=1 Tax=Vibrio rhizosphaerae TaxID=398736 RepID=UPI0029055FF0|nr:RHS repeat-associated core domain-containing protein [Vibrio rhizosphaerae]